MPATKINLTVEQGATFRYPFYWYSDVEVVVPITAITRGYPTSITATSHGLPTSPVPVALLDVPTWLTTGSVAQDARIYGTKVDANTFTVKVDGTGKTAYAGAAGRLVYNAPMDLAAWDARLQIRASVDDTAVILELSTGNSGLVCGADGSIVVIITDTQTDALDFASAVYQLELVDPSTSDVTRLATGKVTLSPQVVRTP